MNPLSNVRNITKLNERELELGVPENASWHQMYKHSSWIFFGGLDNELTEGDVICVFSQWGEIVNIHLIRDQTTGKSKGFGFICYEDVRSTILAVDNFNGIKICGRIIRVDHCDNYKIPKTDKLDPDTKRSLEDGCAPRLIRLIKEEKKLVKDKTEENQSKEILKRKGEKRQDRKKDDKEEEERRNYDRREDRLSYERRDDFKREDKRRDDNRRDDFKRDNYRRDDYRKDYDKRDNRKDERNYDKREDRRRDERRK